MMTRAQRLTWVLKRRQEIEYHVRDAEITLGLCKEHLLEADRLLKELDDAKKRQGNFGNRLTPLQVIKIQARAGKGESDRAIAREFGVAPATIGKFRRIK